jgi:hypothetical protein
LVPSIAISSRPINPSAINAVRLWVRTVPQRTAVAAERRKHVVIDRNATTQPPIRGVLLT